MAAVRFFGFGTLCSPGVRVRAHVGAGGDPAHRLPDHLRGALRLPDAGRPPVRDHVLVRPDRDLTGLPGGAQDRDELVRHRLDHHLAALLLEAHRPAFEVDIALANLRGRPSAGAEVGENGDGKKLLPVLAGCEHTGDVVVGDADNVALLGRKEARPVDPLHRVRVDLTLVAQKLEEALQTRDVKRQRGWRRVVPAPEEAAAIAWCDLVRALPAPDLVGELEKDPLVRAPRLARPLPEREFAHEQVDGRAQVPHRSHSMPHSFPGHRHPDRGAGPEALPTPEAYMLHQTESKHLFTLLPCEAPT